MISVNGNNCLDAWKAGCETLLSNGKDVFNLVTTIQNPAYLHNDWLSIYNPKVINHKSASLSDVINTIFPYRLNNYTTREELYAYYLSLHRSGKRLGCKKKNLWGTYFERMISFGSEQINQIEEIIDVITSDSRHLKALNPIHITSCEYDSLRKRLGNPCLQYVQFTFPSKNIIDVSVVYRNHDFLNKALGNFIGLGQLLLFIAKSTDKQV
mgnify:CR=1 FL=1